MDESNYFNPALLPQIRTDTLPTKLEIIRHLFYYMRNQKKDLNESSALVVDQIIPIWNEAGFSIRERVHCINKIKNLYSDWRNNQKNSNKTSAAVLESLKLFKEDMNRLFDIAHREATNTLNDLRKKFLQDQRQHGCTGSLQAFKLSLEGKFVIYVKIIKDK